jgi:hypothetical protein
MLSAAPMAKRLGPKEAAPFMTFVSRGWKAAISRPPFWHNFFI